MTDIISPLPFNLTNGQVADASQVMADLQQIRGDVNSHQQGVGYRGAVVSASGSQLIAGDTHTAIIFDTVSIDTDSIFSLSHPTRLTVPPGVSVVRLIAQSGIGEGLVSFLALRINGTASYPSTISSLDRVSFHAAFCQVTTPAISCSTGQYFETDVIFETSEDSSQSISNWFEMQILG